MGTRKLKLGFAALAAAVGLSMIGCDSPLVDKIITELGFADKLVKEAGAEVPYEYKNETTVTYVYADDGKPVEDQNPANIEQTEDGLTYNKVTGYEDKYVKAGTEEEVDEANIKDLGTDKPYIIGAVESTRDEWWLLEPEEQVLADHENYDEIINNKDGDISYITIKVDKNIEGWVYAETVDFHGFTAQAGDPVDGLTPHEIEGVNYVTVSSGEKPVVYVWTNPGPDGLAAGAAVDEEAYPVAGDEVVGFEYIREGEANAWAYQWPTTGAIGRTGIAVTQGEAINETTYPVTQVDETSGTITLPNEGSAKTFEWQWNNSGSINTNDGAVDVTANTAVTYPVNGEEVEGAEGVVEFVDAGPANEWAYQWINTETIGNTGIAVNAGETIDESAYPVTQTGETSGQILFADAGEPIAHEYRWAEDYTATPGGITESVSAGDVVNIGQYPLTDNSMVIFPNAVATDWDYTWAGSVPNGETVGALVNEDLYPVTTENNISTAFDPHGGAVTASEWRWNVTYPGLGVAAGELVPNEYLPLAPGTENILVQGTTPIGAPRYVWANTTAYGTAGENVAGYPITEQEPYMALIPGGYTDWAYTDGTAGTPDQAQASANAAAANSLTSFVMTGTPVAYTNNSFKPEVQDGNGTVTIGIGNGNNNSITVPYTISSVWRNAGLLGEKKVATSTITFTIPSTHMLMTGNEYKLEDDSSWTAIDVSSINGNTVTLTVDVFYQHWLFGFWVPSTEAVSLNLKLLPANSRKDVARTEIPGDSIAVNQVFDYEQEFCDVIEVPTAWAGAVYIVNRNATAWTDLVYYVNYVATDWEDITVNVNRVVTGREDYSYPVTYTATAWNDLTYTVDRVVTGYAEDQHFAITRTGGGAYSGNFAVVMGVVGTEPVDEKKYAELRKDQPFTNPDGTIYVELVQGDAITEPFAVNKVVAFNPARTTYIDVFSKKIVTTKPEAAYIIVTFAGANTALENGDTAELTLSFDVSDDILAALVTPSIKFASAASTPVEAEFTTWALGGEPVELDYTVGNSLYFKFDYKFALAD